MTVADDFGAGPSIPVVAKMERGGTDHCYLGSREVQHLLYVLIAFDGDE